MGINPEFGWQTVLIISVLLGVIISLKQLIDKPMSDLRDSINENTRETKIQTVQLAAMNKTIEANEKRNASEHARLWSIADEHGKTIETHETRITVIEENKGEKK